MINRLNSIEKRFEEISVELSKEEVVTDIKKMTELSKEQRRLAPTVEIYQKYKNPSRARSKRELQKRLEEGEVKKTNQ